MNDFTEYWNALNFAIKHYRGHSRKNEEQTPYFIHPIRICAILRAAGYSEFKDREIMIASLFHDLIEDTYITEEIIKRKFGEKVANIVVELSKKPGQKKLEYLKSLKDASKEAKIIKMADRIDNLLEIDVSIWNKKEKISYTKKEGDIILDTCGNSNKELSAILSNLIIEILKKYDSK
jgi:(p)ppGpp synthase/HD superfamily hydrolase